MALEDLRNAAGAAAPRGLQQQAQAAGGGGLAGLREAGGGENAGRQPAWLSGGQFGSTENGWNTKFYEEMFRQQKEAEDSKDPEKLRTLAFGAKYTGVVTHDMANEGVTRKFGDIYDNGVKVGNLRTGEGGFSKEEGNSILAELTLEKGARDRAFKEMANDPTALDKELEKAAKDNEQAYTAWGTQNATNTRVDQVKKDWDDTATGFGAFAAGAAGGAAVGAGLGLVATPIGALLGGIGGAVVGGIGGLLNRDELEDSAARAAVQVEQARDSGNAGGTIGTAARAWGGAAMGTLAPLTNILHGVVDATSEGGLGDSQSGWYENEDRGFLLDAANVGTIFADSMLQFGSGIGRAAFMGTMGAYATGGAAQLASGMGTWDDRRGGFHAPEDGGQWAAALGNTGTDFLQLAMGGFMGRAMSGTLNTAKQAASLTGASADDILRATRTETVGGRVFKLSDEGTALSARPSAMIAVPSEMVTWLGVRAKAQIRYTRGKVNGVNPESFDDVLLAAARDIHNATNLGEAAMLNALAEGTEEAAQAVLEPWSHGWDPDPMDVLTSAIQGGAAGAGMTIGARFGANSELRSKETLSASEARRFVANIRRAEAGLAPVSEDEWANLSEETQDKLHLITQSDRDLSTQIQSIVQERVARPASLNAMSAIVADEFNRMEATSLQNVLGGDEGTHLVRLHGANNSNPEHAIMGGTTVLEDLEAHWEGLRQHLAIEGIDPAAAARLTAALERVDSTDPARPGIRALVQRGIQLSQDDTIPTDEKITILESVNTMLQEFWDSSNKTTRARGEMTPEELAVSVVYSRSPNDNPGSFQIHLPQIDVRDTLEGRGGVRGFHWSSIAGWKQDFDGDTSKNRAYVQLATDPEMYNNLRLGANLLGTREGNVVISERSSNTEVAKAMLREVTLAGGATVESVRDTLNDLTRWISETLADLPSQELVAEQINLLRTSIEGGKPAVKKFMQWLNVTFADEMRELSLNGTAHTKPRSQLYKFIDGRINEALQNWKTQHSLRIPTKWQSENSVSPITETNQPNAVRRLGLTAATPLQSVLVDSEGQDDAFRAIQALYYSESRSGTLLRTEYPGLHSMYSEMFVTISTGLEHAVVDITLSGDELQKVALRSLENLANTYNLSLDDSSAGKRAAGKYAHIGMIATMPIPDMQPDGQGGFVDSGKDITLGELVLREAAIALKRRAEARGVEEAALSKYDIPMFMNAGDAYRRILGPLPTELVIGEASNNHPSGETIEQIMLTYASRSTSQREVYRELARSDVRASGKSRKDLPHTPSMFESGETTAYNAFLQAMFQSVDSARVFDAKTGELHGTEVKRDDTFIAQVEGGQSTLRTEFARLASLYKISIPSEAGQARTDAVTQLLNQVPTFVTHSVAQLVPFGSRAAVFKPLEDGTFNVPDWFVEFLTSTNAEHATMILFRETLLEKFATQVYSKRPFESDDDLMNLMLQVHETELNWKRFLEILATSTSVTEFRQKVNMEFENGPPILAFIRDSALHRPDLTQGGWSMQLPGTEMREAIANFNTSALRFSEFVENEFSIDTKDDALNKEIQRILNSESQDDKDLRGRYERRLKQGIQLPQAMTPNAFVRGAMAMVMDLQANTPEKGTSTDGTEQGGQATVRGPSPAVGTGFGQLLTALTATDAHDVVGNMPALFSGDTVTITDHLGRQFEWALPSFEEFGRLWNDRSNRPMLKAIMMPSVMEWNEDLGSLVQQQMGDGSLSEFLMGDTYGKLLFSPDLDQKLQWVAMLDAQASKSTTGTFSVQMWLSDILEARTSRFNRELTANDYAELKLQALQDIAELTRPLADLNVEALIPAIRESFKERELQKFIPVGDPSIRSAAKKAFVAQLTELEEAGGTVDESVYDSLMGRSSTERLINRFVIDWSDPADAELKMQAISDLILKGEGGLTTATTSPILDELLRSALKNTTGTRHDFSKNEKENRVKWNDASQAVIGIYLQKAYMDVTSLSPASPFTLELADEVELTLERSLGNSLTNNSRFMDGSFDYLLDQILDPNSPIVKAAQELGKIMIPEAAIENSAFLQTDFDRAVRKFTDGRSTGKWSPSIARASIFARKQILAGATDAAIGLSGEAFKRHAAVMRATGRTLVDPGAETARKYKISGALLDALLAGQTTGSIPNPGKPGETVDLLFTPMVENLGTIGDYGEPLAALNGRFVTGARVHYTTSTGEEGVMSLLKNPIHDPLAQGAAVSPITAGDSFSGSGANSTHGYQSISVEKLSAAVASAATKIPGAQNVRVELEYFHPQDQPQGKKYANNLFYEGVALPAGGDSLSSIISTFFMGAEGDSPLGQRYSLDSGKTGNPAFIRPDLPSSDQVRLTEDVNALYDTLWAKTEMMLTRSAGHETLPPILAPAVFKMLKMHHIIRVPDGDTFTLYSAEQAIALQLSGEWDAVSQGAELYRLSQGQLATLLNDSNGYGIASDLNDGTRSFARESEVWQDNLTELAAKHLPTLLDPTAVGNVKTSALAHQGHLRQTSPFKVLRPAEFDAFKSIRRRQESDRSDAIGKRENSILFSGKAAQERRESIFGEVLLDANNLARSPRHSLRRAGMNITLPTAADVSESMSVAAALGETAQSILVNNPYATGFDYRHVPPTTRQGKLGLLVGPDSLDYSAAAMSSGNYPVLGDVVTIQLSDFTTDDAFTELQSVIKHFSARGTYIALKTDGQIDRDLRRDAQTILQELGYRRTEGGSASMWEPPREVRENSRTVASELAKRAETFPVSSRDFHVILHDASSPLEENASFINDFDGTDHSEILIRHTLVPSNAYGGYHFAKTEEELAIVKHTLDQLNADAGMQDALFEMSTDTEYYEFSELDWDRLSSVRKKEAAEKARAEFSAAIARAAASYTMTGTVKERGLPASHSNFGLGDILVQVNNRGKLVFHRNGYEPLRNTTQVKAQHAKMPDIWNGAPIAIYGANIRGASTTVDGLVDSWEYREGAGLEVLQWVKLSDMEGKLALEGTGFKTIATRMSSGPYTLPDFGIMPGMPVDLINSEADRASKQVVKGLASTAQDLIMGFGFDATQAFAKTFLDSTLTPQEWAGLTEEKRKRFRQQTHDILNSVLQGESESLEAISNMMTALVSDGGTNALDTAKELLSLDALQGLNGDVTTLLDKPAAQRDPEATVALAMLIWMQSTKAQSPHEIMTAAGFRRDNRRATVYSTKMPEFFTGIFDRAAENSQLRVWFNEQINSRLQRRVIPGEPEMVGYFLDMQNRLVVKTRAGERDITGFAQFSPVTALGVDPILTQMSSDRRVSATLSQQESLVMQETLGQLPMVPNIFKIGKSVRKLLAGKDRAPLETAADIEALLSGSVLSGQARPVTLGRILTRKQRDRLALQREKMIEMRMPLSTKDESGWSTEDQAAFDRDRRAILRRLGLGDEYLHYVDSWIRAETASPKEKHGTTKGAEGYISPSQATAAMRRISKNIVQGLYPTAGFPISAMTAAEVQVLFGAAQSSHGSWKLAGQDTFEDYVKVALETLLSSAVRAPLQLHANGYYNTFRELGSEYAENPVSMDLLDELGLIDPDTREMTMTLDPTDESRLKNPAISDLYRATLNDLTEGSTPLSVETTGDQDLSAWAKKNDVPVMDARSYNDLMKKGYDRNFRRAGTTTPGFIRNILLLRANMGMTNPILWLASFGEMARAGAVDSIANFLQGYGMGHLAAAFDKLGGDAAFNKLAADLRVQMRNATGSAGEHPAFRTMLNQETTPHSTLSNAGRIERWQTKWQNVVGRAQEGSYGIQQKGFAQRYLIGVLQALESEGSQTTLTPQQLLSEFAANPTFLRDEGYTTLHAGGIKAIENIRMLRPSVLTQLWQGGLDPLTHSPKLMRNMVSNLAIKLPLMFAPFAFNLGTNLLGLQGVNAVAAVALGGREGTMGRIRAKLAGEEYNSERHDLDIVGETLDGVNIAREFIRGGVTHTSLMALGLMAQGLGLSGEDEEERRRRRAAEVAGVGMVFDPRTIERDFRNKDAIYFDNIPGWMDAIPGIAALKSMTEVTGDDAIGGATSMAQLHWSMKMFFSPMMGIERFLNNGDINEIRYGFLDAIGSFPLINVSTFDDANQVSAELAAAAIEAEATGDPAQLEKSFSFMSNMVMTFERMLFENAFASELYQAMDTYDRDNYALVDIENGRIVTDDTGEPQKVQAYQQFEGEDGTIETGRIRPDWQGAKDRMYAEQRPVFAIMKGLFNGAYLPGQEGSLWRYDQAVKERKIDKDTLEFDESTELILSLWDPQNEREVLTLEGSTGIIQGMRMGTVKPGDPALENVFISFEHRQQMQHMFTESIMLDSLNLGLSHEAAEKRVDEIMYGSSKNPYAKPLWDVIWSKGDFAEGVPFNPTTTYRQLNTTYVMGPDGFPWATGFSRAMVMPLQRQLGESEGALPTDDRLNSVDQFADINTGRRGLQATDSSWANPTTEQILEAMGDSTKKIIDEIKQSAFANGDPYGNSYGKGFGGGSRGGGGGGGGGGYSYKLGNPERNNPIYSSNDPYIRVDDPLLRRATVRRERYSSTRGRLTQWQ